uniref:Uncharacterized protein n=1 Tax=Ralstonia solanacearum TaxID=305 RepID=A0A0S4WPL8_RALSL|nr:protein of unknown function [Ralstonia solanacearum]
MPSLVGSEMCIRDSGKDVELLRLIHVRAESAEYWDGPSGLLGKALYLSLIHI